MFFMYRLVLLIIFALVSESFAKVLVAVVETKADDDVLTKQEKFFVTDKLREIASIALPSYQGYSIMTRENIDVMLPPGMTIEECEGSCLAETGQKIAVDYIAQARVGRFAEKLSLTMEMYETRSGKLVSSLTGTSSDVESLLDVIEGEGEVFFKKARQNNDGTEGYIGPDGFSDYSDGSSYSLKRTRSFIIQVESNPDGALLSVDGDPVPSCKATPCKIQLESGRHRFSMVADQYFKKDSTIDVLGGTSVYFTLKPRFGILNIRPTYESRSYKQSSTHAFLNDEYVELGENRLDPGNYELKITNDCYESMSTTVAVKTGSNLTFNEKMKLAKGGLTLSAIRDDEPVDEPVYVDGNYVGRTPYSGDVPVCATVTIGKNQEQVPVTIPYHDEVKFTYEFPSTHRYTQSYQELEDEEDYSYPEPVRTKQSRYSNEPEMETESTANSAINLGSSGGYAQAVLGAGMDLPVGKTAFDDTGLDFLLALFYSEVYVGWKFSGGFFLGVGAGIGFHNPMVMDSSSSGDNYCGGYSCGMSESDGNAMLPSGSFAFLLSTEMGMDFRMDSDMEFAAGVRSTMVVSSWPSISVNLFFEALSFMGMELGFTTITGDDLWEGGGGVSMKMYVRFPTRPGVL